MLKVSTLGAASNVGVFIQEPLDGCRGANPGPTQVVTAESTVLPPSCKALIPGFVTCGTGNFQVLPIAEQRAF